MYKQYEVNPEHKHFTIPKEMPSMNEYLAAQAKNPRAGHSIKRKWKETAAWFARSGLRGWETKNLVIIHYVFYEKNKKRDKDNVFSFASKCIQDALRDLKKINNDGWSGVFNFTHDFYIDKENPRIEVYIEEVENE
jgi:Holliday junction resolvase RusA-like endonuclease